ncbi:16S rRNA (cytosine(967)-C(5))-methyltransferase RsmB [Desulfothermobacter acidiphilus]|uniref:16S rRNA (cytosine(967)-C(5))-methyltransferase RsmB n=1 Tax=Desulfothermobacter acidiphilus TaxID=1938353 RepID=UPI003F8A7101
MAVSARELALRVLYAVDVEGAYGNLALTSVMRRYQPQGPERSLLTELCYGTLRRLNTIDWVLAKFIKRPLCEQNPWIRNILRLTVYQILYLDRIPPAAATNEAVELAKKYAPTSMTGFVNAVLRRVVQRKDQISFPDLQQDPVDHVALKYSHPTWLVKRWLQEFGLEETISICEANNQPAAATLRTNLLRTSREELMERLRKEADLRVSPTRYAPEGIRVQGFFDLQHLPAYHEGLFYIQDESSMLAAHALAPASGAFVLDVCGAPGGKATHLAELMRDSGRILVLDVYAHRLSLVVANARRLGLKSVETLQADVRSINVQFAGQADYVLADVPCSGLGVLRRKPDIRWRKEPNIFSSLITLQQEILDSASACVRPGGVLLYCTCTLGEAENLEQIRHFLARHPEFMLEDLLPFLPRALDREGTLRHGYIQIMPYQGMDGFFLARLRRKKLN